MKITVLHPGDLSSSTYDVEYVEFEGRVIIEGGHYGDFKVIDPGFDEDSDSL